MEDYRPENFPYILPDKCGEITAAKKEAPGIYYIATLVETEGQICPYEFYVVDEFCNYLSPLTLSYGKRLHELPLLLFFPIVTETDGHDLVEYEFLKYKEKNGLLGEEDETPAEMAALIADSYPNYFVEYPAPIITPWGSVLRSTKLCNGVYWIMSSQATQILAVCYPKWSCDLSVELIKIGKMNDNASFKNPSFASYMFYKEEDACRVLFELWPRYKSLQKSVDHAALMNAIWEVQPAFAATHNLREQLGLHDTLGLLLKALGKDIELHRSSDNIISMKPDAGTDFIIQTMQEEKTSDGNHLGSSNQ